MSDEQSSNVRPPITVQDGYRFNHVHDCTPARIGGKCRYDWSEHIITGDGHDCPCRPHVDDRNVAMGKRDVFVVHKGNE